MTVQSITAVPSFVIVGGANTNQPVLSNTVLATRSTSVTIGEGNITEVTYVNIDPPFITVDPGNTRRRHDRRRHDRRRHDRR